MNKGDFQGLSLPGHTRWECPSPFLLCGWRTSTQSIILTNTRSYTINGQIWGGSDANSSTHFLEQKSEMGLKFMPLCKHFKKHLLLFVNCQNRQVSRRGSSCSAWVVSLPKGLSWQLGADPNQQRCQAWFCHTTYANTGMFPVVALSLHI